MADIVSKIAGEVDSFHTRTVEEADKLIDDFSSIVVPEEAGIPDIEERLSVLNENILTWDYDQATSKDNPEEIFVLLEYVNEVQQLEEILQTVRFTNEEYAQNNLLNCAQSILQMAIGKLMEEFSDLLRQIHHEFSHLLIKHHKKLELDCKALSEPADENFDDSSCSSFGDEPSNHGSHKFTNRSQETNLIALVSSSIISNLKCIALFLFKCSYGKECCQTYIFARKVALEDCLLILGMETFGIEEVLKMDWNNLNRVINLWKHATKVFTRVYLASDKSLCNLIFGELPRSIELSCFTDTLKSSVFQLLSFADAVAISAPKPEKLFQILDIYEALDGFLVDIDIFFPEDYGVSISNECHHVLSRLSDSIKTTMDEFKWQIMTSTSTIAFQRAGVHQITKYVMNYMKALAAYDRTINLLPSDQPEENQYSASENSEERSSELLCSPFARYLKSVSLLLESNLDAKSHLYNDVAMSNVFMMNNIFYVVQKVQNSYLSCFVADEWIRAHIAKFQRHARDYQRASWTSVISYLMEEDYQNCGTMPKKVIKKRFKGFNNAFEEVYQTQTGWLVPDAGLRDDLRIAISSVLQAYRVFLGRYSNCLEGEKHVEKYIKYSADDLETYLLDLFEGSEKSLHYHRAR